MTQELRVGVIGTSNYADRSHLPRVKSHPQASLAAICGRNRVRAQEMADKYAVPEVFTDYQEMIDSGNLDAVIVSTPDDLHYPMTMRALDARLHVLCEKPLALNKIQAKEMHEKAEAVGVKHMICFTYRWAPPLRYLKQLIDDGYIGRCQHCRFSYLAGYGRTPRYGWKFDRQRGLGALGDLGSHMIDLARWFVGDIAKVSATLNTFVQRPGVSQRELDPANDAAFLAIEFDNGARGVFEFSSVAHLAGQEQHIRLYGKDGTLEADLTLMDAEIRGARQDESQLQTLSVPNELWRGGDMTQPLMLQVMEAFVRQPVGDRLFIDAILENRAVSPNFYDGFKVQEVIDAALQSDQNEEWVSI